MNIVVGKDTAKDLEKEVKKEAELKLEVVEPEEHEVEAVEEIDKR